jgi:putative heme-binding domain-containing protein
MSMPVSTSRVSAFLALVSLFGLSAGAQINNPPQDLADRFELPPGFHIYRAAGPDLSGGSYALTFDGEGRLLVGDGNAVRRLIDKDNDGVFDSYEVIATGMGWRGPQGLLVYEDKLYAVGGDGIQVFEGYRSGKELIHKGRIGNRLNTGGDHDAHTIFRGHDGWLYFMAGNGAGMEDRKHITEESSPVLFEREASVFRISPDGTKWECLAAGGRNPPNLGMNYLGELFSFDSDMEWHVGLPWYRPVRLNHWAIGGDQGWQEVGAYPPYYIDCLPGILDVGRGSPNWGVFYEHNQFPDKYRDAFVVCDYRWKRESNDQYATTGRLVTFFLKREGAGWKASMETLARPKPDARDADGQPINFALVDVAVASDGSLFVSDHNQGIWRIFYSNTNSAASDAPPPFVQVWRATDPKERLEELLSLPQPASEWSRQREWVLRNTKEINIEAGLRNVLLNARSPLFKRLRALRLLSADFARLDNSFIATIARDTSPEIRAQAAWLTGIRMREAELPLLLSLLTDKDAFVRRRATDALTRFHSENAITALIERLGDPERLVRHVAMAALAHYPTTQWFDKAAERPDPQVCMRALVSSQIRRDPPTEEKVRRVVASILKQEGMTREDRLDFLRVLGLFQKQIESDAGLKRLAAAQLLTGFPSSDREIRWEQVRLLGAYNVVGAFTRLLDLIEKERGGSAQFHIGQAISRLDGGWTASEEVRLLHWMQGTQEGWFSQFDDKGVEFPLFWSTVLADFARHHRDALLGDLSKVDFASLLGGVVIDLLADSPDATQGLITLYRKNNRIEARVKIVSALKKTSSPQVGAFLREEFVMQNDSHLKGAILQGLAVQPVDQANAPLLREGLRHSDVEVVRACAAAIVRCQLDLDESLANLLVGRMAERRSLFYPMDRALVALSGQNRPGHQPEPEPGQRLEESTRSAAIAFWKDWYEGRFGKRFEASLVAGLERSDEELHRMVLHAELRSGDTARGAKVYERLQCNSCHGGGVTPGQEGRLFGPDLAGITRRLSHQELADAIVYPSKQVAERFQAREVQLKEGEAITGFITEQTDDTLTLAARNEVHRIPRSRIRAVEPQAASLMPERLLNALTDDEIRDLLAFLDHGIGSMGATDQGTKR